MSDDENKKPMEDTQHIVDESAFDRTYPAETLSSINSIEKNLEATQTQPARDPEASAASAEVQEEKTDEFVRPKQNVTNHYPINADKKLPNADTIELPSIFTREATNILNKLPNIQLLDTDEARRWANVVSESIDYCTFDENFVPSLEDPDSEWTNKPEINGVSFGSNEPKFKPVENTALTGERAILRIVNHMGLGTVFSTALYHSGFWVTFKPPTEAEIVDLNRLMIADKIQFGRTTYGLAFTNTTAYTVARLMEFALAHVYQTSVKPEDMKISDIFKHMSCQDIPSFLWGFICTMYPRGFNYERPCMADPENCKHVLEETINVMKLQYTNTQGLSDWQKTHMSGRQQQTKDLASVNRYKDELSKLQKRKIFINKDEDTEIAFVLKTPSVQEYIDAGHRWIGSIVETVERSLEEDANTGERNSIIHKYGQATAMRQYRHWVDSIEYATNTIEDPETIDKAMDVLSADDVVREKFTTSVVDYINKSMISVIGIPVYDCPACEKEQKSNIVLPAHTNIIPLDVMQVFFGLHIQRLSKLTER